jgi:hypothetical protein
MTAFGQKRTCNMPGKFQVSVTEFMLLPGGRYSLAASVDAPYLHLANAVSALSVPQAKLRREKVSLRVELTLPDGSKTQQVASIALVNPLDAPGIIVFSGLSASDIPIGTSVELLWFQVQPL